MTNPTTIDAATTRLVKILSIQAKASIAVLDSAVRGDETATRKSIDDIRVLRSKLQDIPREARNLLEMLSPQIKSKIQADLNQIQRADNFIPLWCQRYTKISSYEELCKTSNGINAQIDTILPNAWDFDKDIIVLTTLQQSIFISALIERGQKRIITTTEMPPEVLQQAGVLFINSTETLRQYLLKIERPYPVRIAAIHRSGDKEDLDTVRWEDITQVFTLFLTNQNTLRIFGNRWLTQGISNLAEIAASSHLTALGNTLQGLPFVIVAPGPSLDKNIHLLKQLKGRAVVMAAAQCARALSKAGVVPDFIVVIDPGDISYFLDDVDTSEVDALLVGVSCHPDFFKRKFKSKIVLNSNALADRWISNLFEETIPLSSAGSVSVASAHVAKYLGCGALILVGQDLALSGGKQYSSQSANSQTVPLIDNDGQTLTYSNVSKEQEKIFDATGTSSKDTIEPVLTLPGYYGGTVNTRANYHIFHGEFVHIASQENLSESPIPLINCTEGGAFIEGFLHIPLSEAIERYIPIEDCDISQIIEKATDQVNQPDRYRLITKKLDSMKVNLEEAIRIAKKCQSMVLQTHKTSRNSHQISTLERKLIKIMADLPAMALPNQDEIRQAVAMSADANTVEENYGAASILYQSIIATGSMILPLVNNTLSTCRSRQ
jgi:hypothetical protein